MDYDPLPQSKKAREYEVRARALRDFAGLRFDDEPLDPFQLARYAKLTVVAFSEIKGLSDAAREQLLGAGKDSWSGGAASLRLPDGGKLIILNPTQSRNRQNATLMEEICHVFLGHRPSRLAIEVKSAHGALKARDYNREIEEEAYGVGAAALVPFTALQRFVESGKGSDEISRHFRVSIPLVEYRLKITLLWEKYRRSHTES
ncbi:MAG: hypothetical protein C4325_06485 [Blastocatellia bacterium]